MRHLVPADRRPARRLPHHPRQDRAPTRAAGADPDPRQCGVRRSGRSSSEREHTLELSIDRGNLWVDGDPTRLEQVVVNLLTNAAKYTEDGGHIRLSARDEGDEVVISVKDDGVGIPPEKLPADVRAVRPGGPLARPLRGGARHRADAGQEARRDARRQRRGRRAKGPARGASSPSGSRGPRRPATPEAEAHDPAAAGRGGRHGSWSSTTTWTRPAGWRGS